MATTPLLLRAARDRLVDLLGLFGETYPLQDVEVDDEKLTVPFDQVGRIPVDPGQQDVVYELLDEHGNLLPPPGGTPGSGGRTLLPTPPVVEDATYTIRARKIDSGREVYLLHHATVKVGLDTALAAHVLSAGDGHPEDAAVTVLSAHPDAPANGDPRLVEAGASVRVELESSQEGVVYSLVRLDANGNEIVISEADVHGNLHDIVLTTRPLEADTEIRVRGIRHFDAVFHREPQTALLEVVLPVLVRPDAGLAVLAEPPLIASGAAAAVVLPASQPGVEYRLLLHTLRDQDFIYGDAGQQPVQTLAHAPDIHVKLPRPGPAEPPGYRPWGELLEGTGGELRWQLGPLDEDTVGLVQACKRVASPDPASPDLTLALQLNQAALVLVRPDATVALELGLPVLAGEVDELQVAGGQEGVLYFFHLAPDGEPWPDPACFYRLRDGDPEQPRGLGGLRVGGDFAVARSPFVPGIGNLRIERDFVIAADPEVDSEPATASPETNETAGRSLPLPPVLDFEPVALPIEIAGRAVKVRSRVDAPLAATAQVPALPEIALEETELAPGSKARMLVYTSREGEKYQPFLGGAPVKQARNGNGQDLVFLSEPLTETTTFDLRVTRPADPGPAVIRIVRLTAVVRSTS